jgi:two-component system, chemotaxis family, sensor kinase CheA
MKQQIETLSELIVSAEPADLRSIAQMHTIFEEIIESKDNNFDPVALEASTAAADILQQIMMHQVADEAASLQVVADTVTTLQALVNGVQTPQEAEYPSSLGIESPSSEAEDEVDTGAEAEVEAEVEAQAEAETETTTEANTNPQPEDTTTTTTDETSNEEAAPTESASESAPEATAEEPVDMTGIQLTGDQELVGEFVDEAMEHLEAADVSLLTIESNPHDEDAINSIFRAFHTIKGVAGFLDLGDIQSLAHEAEFLLDKARQKELELTNFVLDVTFDSIDALKQLTGFVRNAVENGTLIERLPGQAKLITRIKAALAGEADPSSDSTEPLPTAEPDQAIGSILVDAEMADADDVETVLDKQEEIRKTTPKIGQLLVENKVASPKNVAHALRSQKTAQGEDGATNAAAGKLKETVRVDSERLDALVDTIGEIVIAEAMVTQAPEIVAVDSDRVVRLLSHLNKITRELQEMAASLRLVPVRSTFQRMARLVRDVAKKLNKKVNFVTKGEETELDKAIVDQIGDPLVHMVRNSVDHGVESTEDRIAAGKPENGTVELRAFHKGGEIYIEIEDDGAGLDKDRILKKAIKNGLVQESDTLTDNEIYNLVFEPGFSMAAAITDVSGRGVGMDVVKRNIQAMRGHVDIKSELGKGTVFSIRLPLTLAIIEGMVVRTGDCRYIMPLLSITRMLRPEEHAIPTVFGQAEMLQTSEGLIPLYRLHQIFDIDGAETDASKAAVVVVEYEGKRVGLLIDELLGQQQIVIKSLGTALKDAVGLAGGAIMPDGLVGLILDIDGLVRLAGTTKNEARLAA